MGCLREKTSHFMYDGHVIHLWRTRGLTNRNLIPRRIRRTSWPKTAKCLKNWKHLLKNAAMTALTVIVSILAVTLIAFVLFGGAFRLLGWSGFVAFVLAVMLAWTVKCAFIDRWMMVKMMHGYIQVAPTTVIIFGLYTKLSGFSGKFKQLFKESRVTPETIISRPYTPAQSPVDAPATETRQSRLLRQLFRQR